MRVQLVRSLFYISVRTVNRRQTPVIAKCEISLEMVREWTC